MFIIFKGFLIFVSFFSACQGVRQKMLTRRCDDLMRIFVFLNDFSGVSSVFKLDLILFPFQLLVLWPTLRRSYYPFLENLMSSEKF